MEQIAETIKEYILREFLPDAEPEELTFATELTESGILDSLATLRLRAYLEEEYDIELQAHELTADYFGTIQDIARLIVSKTEE